MTHQLTLTDEELEELTIMLNRELVESRVEYRRTAREFRGGIDRSLDVKRGLLSKVEAEFGVPSRS